MRVCFKLIYVLCAAGVFAACESLTAAPVKKNSLLAGEHIDNSVSEISKDISDLKKIKSASDSDSKAQKARRLKNSELLGEYYELELKYYAIKKSLADKTPEEIDAALIDWLDSEEGRRIREIGVLLSRKARAER